MPEAQIAFLFVAMGRRPALHCARQSLRRVACGAPSSWRAGWRNARHGGDVAGAGAVRRSPRPACSDAARTNPALVNDQWYGTRAAGNRMAALCWTARRSAFSIGILVGPYIGAGLLASPRETYRYVSRGAVAALAGGAGHPRHGVGRSTTPRRQGRHQASRWPPTRCWSSRCGRGLLPVHAQPIGIRNIFLPLYVTESLRLPPRPWGRLSR